MENNLSPAKIDQALYEKQNLKVALIDNFKEMNEGRPIQEFRECMIESSRNFLKGFFAANGKELTQDEINEFEKQYYGIL